SSYSLGGCVRSIGDCRRHRHGGELAEAVCAAVLVTLRLRHADLLSRYFVTAIGRCSVARCSITWSARSSSGGGVVRPTASGVLALMKSSNVVACSTGRSPGFAPFRMRSTYFAARRNIADTLVP